MGIINMSKNIKEIHPNKVVLYKVGTFYNAYGKDAYIVSYIFGYNIKQGKDNIAICGFPSSIISKVEASFENKKIDYILLDVRNNYDEDEKQENGNLNKYEEILEKATRYVKLKRRIDEIHNYLLDEIFKEDIKGKIRKIEDIIYANREV